jgi:hypothetical protein
MEYIKRLLNRDSTPSQPQPLQPQLTSGQLPISGPTRQHRRKHRRGKMASFNGPWTRDLSAFKKSVESIPDNHKASFQAMSSSVLEKLCDPDALHVWETDSDIDNLLQLTSVIAKLCDLGVREVKESGTASMLIITEVKDGRDNFARVCDLVRYLVGVEGKRHLDGNVCAFGGFIVVKGWNNTRRADGDAIEVVRRINISLEKGLKASKGQEIVWHHGPVVHSLLHWINNTTSTLRSSLSALSITGSLNLTSRVGPSPTGRSNTLPDLERLEQYARRLSIPVIFLDAATQSITFDYLAIYMYFFAYYINTFLPTSLSHPHLHKALDDLTTFTFRLHAASHTLSPTATVRLVKEHLDPTTARPWARTCIQPATYNKSACLQARSEPSIHHAVQLADCPFAPFHPGPPRAFARLAIGPAAPLAATRDSFVAAPVHIAFATARMRACAPSRLHVLLPAPSLDEEKATHRIQGLMMGVLERVRQEKGNPVLGAAERAAWAAGVKAWRGALEDAVVEGMPERVRKMVGLVTEKLDKGTWGYALGGEAVGAGKRKGAGSGAVEANRAAEAAYAATQFARSQVPSGYGIHQGYMTGQHNGGAYSQDMGGPWY